MIRIGSSKIILKYIPGRKLNESVVFLLEKLYECVLCDLKEAVRLRYINNAFIHSMDRGFVLFFM